LRAAGLTIPRFFAIVCDSRCQNDIAGGRRAAVLDVAASNAVARDP
jgi:hypothetical protein